MTTANTASTNASNAVTTANSATATANAAASTVASAVFYTPVANFASFPGSPSNQDRIEVTDSTGLESQSIVSGIPSGFTGSSDLTMRLQYNSSTSKWDFQQYFAEDPEARYMPKQGGTMTGLLTLSGAPTATLHAATKAYVDAANTTQDSTVATNTSNISTNTTAIATKMATAGGTFTGDVSFDDNVIVKGDGTNGSGELTLNCENNSHGIKIKGPPHSAGANYTLTLPNDTGTNGQALTTNGSGVLSFDDVSSSIITSTDFAYKPSSNTATLAGPSTSTNPTGYNNYIGLHSSGNAIIRFEKSTNLQFYNLINQLSSGDSIDVNWNNGGTQRTDTTTFHSLTDNTVSGVVYGELSVNSTLGTFGVGSYPFGVTSTNIINGTDPVTNNQVLKYKTATSKWTVDDDGLSTVLPLAGGTLTGALTLSGNPTAANHAANKSYVDTEVAGIVDSAPGTLDTLNELAAALGDDPNFATTVTNSIATKLPLAGGTLTGGLTGTSATFTGSVQAGGSPLNGVAQGTALGSYGSVNAARTTGSNSVFNGFTVGTSTPTSSILANGSATFAGTISTGGASASAMSATGARIRNAGDISIRKDGSSASCLEIFKDGDATSNKTITFSNDGSAVFVDKITVGSTTGRGQYKGICPSSVTASSATFLDAQYNGSSVAVVKYDGSAEFAGIVSGVRFSNPTNSYDPWLKGVNSSGIETFNVTKEGSAPFSGDVAFNSGGANAVNIGAGGDIRLQAGSWTGESNAKIQYHASALYLQYPSTLVFRNSSGNDRVTVNNNGDLTADGNATFAGTVSDSVGPLRRLNVAGKSSNFTLTAANAGTLIRRTGGNATVPANVFSAGDMITIFNAASSGDMTVLSSAVTLINSADGDAGNTRTIASKGMATIVCTASNEFVISGTQLS